MSSFGWFFSPVTLLVRWGLWKFCDELWAGLFEQPAFFSAGFFVLFQFKLFRHGAK